MDNHKLLIEIEKMKTRINIFSGLTSFFAGVALLVSLAMFDGARAKADQFAQLTQKVEGQNIRIDKNETKGDALQADVSDIKGDIKVLNKTSSAIHELVKEIAGNKRKQNSFDSRGD